MRLCLITDIHFDVRGGSQFFLDKYKQFFVQQFFPYLKENNITTLLIGGDTWESRKNININSMHHAKRMFFELLEANNIETISILGNHDVVYKNTNEVHSMEFIEDTYSNFKTVYDTEIIDFDGCKVGFVSWINKENYNDRLEFIKTADCDYLLGHFEINGFEMTKGHECSDGLKDSMFIGYDEVWSGHFHIKNKIGNIRYLGNPFQTNRGDINYDRGFHVFDTETRQLEFVKNEYNIYEAINFHDNIDISTFDFMFYANKIVIVYVHNLLEANGDLLNIFIDKLNALAYKVEVEETNSISYENVEVDDINVKTHTEIISDYIDNVLDDENKKVNIKNIMIERYNECLNDSD